MKRFAHFSSRLAAVGFIALLCTLAAQAAGMTAYVGNFSDNSVSVVDVGAGRVLASIPVVAGPHGMVAARDGRTVFVSGDGGTDIAAIDTSSRTVRRTLTVGKMPHGLALTPDGRWLLAAVYGEDRVAFVDPETFATAGSVAVPKPHTIAIRPDGAVAYVASQEPGHFALAVIDLATRSVVRRIALDKTPRDLEFGFDGKALYVTEAGINSIQVLDPKSDAIVAQIPTGASPHIAGVYAGAPAGTAVVQGPGELLLFDPATHAALRTIKVGQQPHWVATNATTAVVTNEGSNDIAIIDLASGAVRTVPVGKAPRKVVLLADATPGAASARVGIANFAFMPAEITVARGTRVTWSNDDGAPHGLRHKDGAPGQDLILPSANASRVYDTPGTYDYECAVHPYMTGRVIVTGR